MKYDNIHTIQDLDIAMGNVRKRLALQEVLIKTEVESVKSSFSTRNVVAAGLGAVTKFVSFDKLLLLGFGLMRKRLFRKKR